MEPDDLEEMHGTIRGLATENSELRMHISKLTDVIKALRVSNPTEGPLRLALDQYDVWRTLEAHRSKMLTPA